MQSVTCFSFALQSELPSGMRWPPTYKSTSWCRRCVGCRVPPLPVQLRLDFLFPCTQSRKLTPHCSALLHWEGEGKERTVRPLPKAIPHALACASEQRQRAPELWPYAGPPPALPPASPSPLRPSFLFHLQGVWIPTFGSFDTISEDISTEDGTVTLRWPVFQLARNLIAMHHLKSCRESLPGRRGDETLAGFTDRANRAAASILQSKPPPLWSPPKRGAVLAGVHQKQWTGKHLCKTNPIINSVPRLFQTIGSWSP